MANPNLSESAWQRAKLDAEGIYKTTTFGVALAIMELLAVPAAVLATAGHNDTATQVAVPIISGALAVALAFIVVLVVQLAAAPVRQRNELRQGWDQPEPEPAQTVNVELTLRDFRRKGSDLLKSFSGGYATEDEEAAERWTAETIEFLSQNCETDLASRFIDASQNHTEFIRSLEARLSALRGIINSLG